MATHFPYDTLKAIAATAQQVVTDQINTQIMPQLVTIQTNLQKIIQDKGVSDKILEQYGNVPVYNPSANPQFYGFITLYGTGGQTTSVQVKSGEIVSKYIAFWHAADQLLYQKNAQAAKPEVTTGPNPAVINKPVDASKKATLAVTSASSVPQIQAAIQQAEQIEGLIKEMLMVPELQGMPTFLRFIIEIQDECSKKRVHLFEKLGKSYNTDGHVSYPSLDESFQQREVSYKIEPSGIQGSGRDSRFAFYDFLKSRKIDEDSD